MKDEDKSATQLLVELRELRQQLNGLRLNGDVQSLSQISCRELFDRMSNGVAVYEAKNNGQDFIFRDFNKAGEKIDNIKKEDLIGKSVHEVFPGVKEFGLFDSLQRVWQTGNPEHHPVSMYADDRICGWRENYIYKLPDGQIVAVYEDVTGHKEAVLTLKHYKNAFEALVEESAAEFRETNRKLNQEIEECENKYRSIINSIWDGIAILDLQGNIIEVNDCHCEMLGYTREEMIGTSITNYIHPDRLDDLADFQDQLEKEGKVLLESVDLHKDGTAIPVEVRGTLCEYLGRTVLMGLVRDITKLRYAQEN